MRLILYIFIHKKFWMPHQLRKNITKGPLQFLIKVPLQPKAIIIIVEVMEVIILENLMDFKANI